MSNPFGTRAALFGAFGALALVAGTADGDPINPDPL